MTLARVVDDVPAGRAWVELMAPAAELAKAIATTDFVPRPMRNNAPAIAAAILYGDEVGLGPMQSLAKIAVIEGRPFVAAEAQRALVYAAGHEMWLDELTATRATWSGRRHGSDNVTRITWTLDDARRAGISGKNNWRSYPRQMLSARASAELVRAVFADVVGGLGASEEIDDLDVVGTVDGGVATVTTPAVTRRRRRRAAVTAGESAPTSGDTGGVSPPVDLPPLPDERQAQLDATNAELHERIAESNERLADVQREQRANDAPAASTRSQRDRMHGLMKRRGIVDRGDRLRLTTAVIGRVVTSSTELTAAEADALLDYLESTPEVDDDGDVLTGEQQSLDVDEVEP